MAPRALILTKRSLADRDGLPTLAEIKGHATHSQEPQWFTTAPISRDPKAARQGRLERRRCRPVRDQRSVLLLWRWRRRRDLGIPRDRLNVNGGACRARPPHRRHRRSVDRDAAACTGSAEPENAASRHFASAAAKATAIAHRARRSLTPRHRPVRRPRWRQITSRPGYLCRKLDRGQKRGPT